MYGFDKHEIIYFYVLTSYIVIIFVSISISFVIVHFSNAMITSHTHDHHVHFYDIFTAIQFKNLYIFL